MNRWKVKQHLGGYAIYDGDSWYDWFETHPEAVIWAHRYAVIEEINNGALATWRHILRWLVFPAS